MKEDRKKLSLLTNLYNILFNDFIFGTGNNKFCFVNDNIFSYKFYHMSTLIVNGAEYDVSNKVINITLYLDELLIEVNNKVYSLPYNLIEEVYIILED